MKTVLRAISLLGAVMVTCFIPSLSMALDLDNELARWMGHVSDTASLADLTIPGTHDSGATHEHFGGTAKCQNLTVRDQLDIGVRYLDIRLRHYGDSLVVHHGSVYQHLNFNDVLIQVTDFLEENPSEVVMMEVSQEYTPDNNTRSFEQTFVTYTDDPAYTSYWWRHSYVPVVGDVRGKIVLLRRFSGSFWNSGGIDITGWPDNAAFTRYDTRSVAIDVQDYYKVNMHTNDNKWSEIRNWLEAAQWDTSGTLFLNFTSGVRPIFGIPNIPIVSDDINDRLIDYFKNVSESKVHHGVVISDFISKELIKAELRPYLSYLTADERRFSDLIGGPHGTAFNDVSLLPAHPLVSELKLRTGKRLDRIETVLSNGYSFGHGGMGGDEQALTLTTGEYFTSVHLCVGKHNSTTRVFSARFDTSDGRSLSGGTSTSNCVTFAAPDGWQIVAFHGRSGDEIDKLGVVYAPITQISHF
jgi:1-phosphatidylinositol phosphodiesterase